MTYNNYKIQNAESKIRALETIWYGWVEYFRPGKVNTQSPNYRAYKEKIIRYELDHAVVIEEIAKRSVGSVESMNATNALYVQGRIKNAYAELKILQGDAQEIFYL